jgi:ABC-type uncharacterized transport system permease subunit
MEIRELYVEIILSAVSLGLLWAIMVIGVYLTYRILDIADLSVGARCRSAPRSPRA